MGLTEAAPDINISPVSPLKEVYERYLAEEAAIRMPDVSFADRGRFHFCVLQSAVAWSRHPKSDFRLARGKHTFVLNFEGPIEGKMMTMFSFHSAVETGEYRFTGLNLAKAPPGLSPIGKAALERLSDLFEAALPQAQKDEGVVTVVVRKAPTIDFLPIVDEARRVLDEGNQEFQPVDFSQVVVPTEAASLFVGKTNVSPAPRPKVKFVPPPVVVPVVKHDPEGEDSDDESDSEENEANESEAETESQSSKAKPAAATAKATPVRSASKPVSKTPLTKAQPAKHPTSPTAGPPRKTPEPERSVNKSPTKAPTTPKPAAAKVVAKGKPAPPPAKPKPKGKK